MLSLSTLHGHYSLKQERQTGQMDTWAGLSLWGIWLRVAAGWRRVFGWVLGDGGTVALTRDGLGGVRAVIRVGSPKNAVLEGGLQREGSPS